MAKGMLIRQWKLVEALHGAKVGFSVKQLCSKTGTSRATVYRDLELLKQAGVPIEKETVNGESRYRLSATPLPAMRITPLQLAAVKLARKSLAPLAGTTIVTELDTLLSSGDALAPDSKTVSIPNRTDGPNPNIVRIIDQAIRKGRQLRLLYRSTQNQGDTAQSRLVDPMFLHMDGPHTYLYAHDHERKDLRTFKLARIEQAKLLKDRVSAHPEYEQRLEQASSVKVWDSPPSEVVVQISKNKARFVQEWRLSNEQLVTLQPDGSILVKANVAGSVEAMRWVLSWGKDARAVAPAELVERVAEEVQGAAHQYAALQVSINLSHDR